ncbi:MAG: thiamine pyrophosphate-binding protein, partial [Nitriliruptorales bacterium]|nr:thiamine pyrophosphate-binding protein [Nitriliruptorales bacterium]
MTEPTSETLLGGGAGEYATIPAHHGGVAIAEVLAAAGIERIFGLPGGHIAALFQGCEALGIEVLTTRHESAAVHMAEAIARTTGRTGVAAITAGPGFTNAVTGLANAERTGIPVAVFGGRTPLSL